VKLTLCDDDECAELVLIWFTKKISKRLVDRSFRVKRMALFSRSSAPSSLLSLGVFCLFIPAFPRVIPPPDHDTNDIVNNNNPAVLESQPQHQQGIPAPDVNSIKDGRESENILPPDHIDGVRLEQDGDLNRDFHKEVILGNHEEMEQRGVNDTDNLLRAIFDRVDADSDGLLGERELEDWIKVKIQEHYDEATEENERIFESLDPDKDGFVEWKEYLRKFLIDKGFPDDLATQQANDYDAIHMPEDVKDKMIRFRFRWSEADDEPQDNRLTSKEFLSFMHPEHSKKTLETWVKDIMRGLDMNGDGVITEAEFSALPVGQVDEQWEKADKDWQDERRKEFQRVIDLDHDGRVSVDELMFYVDPKNANHARAEAHNLIELVDSDKDGALSLDEVIAGKEVILGSKMVHTGQSLHDEF